MKVCQGRFKTKGRVYIWCKLVSWPISVGTEPDILLMPRDLPAKLCACTASDSPPLWSGRSAVQLHSVRPNARHKIIQCVQMAELADLSWEGTREVIAIHHPASKPQRVAQGKPSTGLAARPSTQIQTVFKRKIIHVC